VISFKVGYYESLEPHTAMTASGAREGGSASGRVDPERGIREFVVGTGGKSHYEIEIPLTNSEVHNDYTYGLLKLTLHPKSYDWRFIPVAGETFTDSGHDRCH
jgi:hypothetical protein